MPPSPSKPASWQSDAEKKVQKQHLPVCSRTPQSLSSTLFGCFLPPHPPTPLTSSFPDAGLKLSRAFVSPVSAHLHVPCGRGTSARPRCPRKKGTRKRRARTSAAGFLWASRSTPPSHWLGVELTPALCSAFQATCGQLAGVLPVDAALHLHVCALLHHNSDFLPAGAVRDATTVNKNVQLHVLFLGCNFFY